MNEIKDVGRRLKEACLSGSVATLDTLIEDDELILDRVSSLSGFYSDSPLHVAVLRSHVGFHESPSVAEPKLATELDLQRRSPLHLASAEGHVEIVRELVRGNLFPHLCFARDQDGTHIYFSFLWLFILAVFFSPSQTKRSRRCFPCEYRRQSSREKQNGKSLKPQIP
ncbi:hypothetical protein RHMOL_Rhmol12G0219600 [Rhododendron molle]|uniref:Uncharacterized protein n=1 Tax=Rhododendron molle TaxID=49168 RepID=A0ACC0LM15_RHOML|nr:hypothetical protein RHMOL_Rhmol12G0219600 [Rhododendron molle]